MKQYYFELPLNHKVDIVEAIRSKKQIVKLLMQCIKTMIVYPSQAYDSSKDMFLLRVSKMSRLFFILDEKQFSVCFPFLVTENSDGLKFKTKFGLSIDSQITSQVLTVFGSSNILETSSIHDLYESIDETGNTDNKFWLLIQDLLLFEDGYIRFENDPVRQNGLLHPLIHYDVFYSNKATFKVGLNAYTGHQQLVDLLDIQTNCHFLA